jgi:hypothetical protein
MREDDPKFTHEHNVQNKLFGVNDYIPYGEQVSRSIHESVEEDPTNKKRLHSVEEDPTNKKRLLIKRTGGAGNRVSSISVPKHMWVGGKLPSGEHFKGMDERNEMRASVYGGEHRAPLTINEIEEQHKKTLNDHFAKPKKEQEKLEKEAIARLHAAGHLDNKDTTDEGEKTDTVQNEHDEHGRSFEAASSKGVAGHAVYTSGHGENQKQHILNTCPAQTEGCGGGINHAGVADTSKGTCFAPKAESQYPGASVRRAAHEQAKHDPAMTNDWILAHTHSLRKRAAHADKKNKRFLFRPNVVDETDRSSRHAIKHLNSQRAEEGKPPIVGNSYGKTDEMHDPENNWHVTYSNTGPKVKPQRNATPGKNSIDQGEVPENARKNKDMQRIRQTISATDAHGKDLVNDQGKKIPPKNSYMVTNLKRGSDEAKAFEKNVTHAKYWSHGREDRDLSQAEKSEGPEGHFDGNGKPTTPDKAHYGHKTITGDDGVSRRYDYQKQHILHPRLVQVGKNEDGSPHMIPTDSRFKDNEFLPPDSKRFKTKNKKIAGGIIATTPTESTSDVQHHSNFTHHVGGEHIEHAAHHNGEYEIDKPEDQEEARGKKYVAPQPNQVINKQRKTEVAAKSEPKAEEPRKVVPFSGKRNPNVKIKSS